MNTSPLADVQRAMGAEFTTYGSWQVVEHFGMPAAEYDAARTACAVFDLSCQGKLRVTGSDRIDFLQSRLTNDVAGLPVGWGMHAAALQRTGCMLGDMRLYALDGYHLLEMAPPARERLGPALEDAITTEDVKIADISREWGLLSLIGPESGEALAALGIEAPRDREILSADLGGHPVLVAGRRRALVAGFDLFARSSDLVECWNSATEGGARPAGLFALNVLRVEAGVPWYGVDMDENTNPLEAGMEDAISYRKGCYVGREAITRIHHLGMPARLLRGILLEGEGVPAAGAAVFAGGAEIGRVTSAVYSPALDQPVALAFLRKGHTDVGVEVTVAGAGGPIAGRVTALPFVPEAP